MLALLVFVVTLVFELVLGVGLVVSLLCPEHRIWPPPKKGSWQYWFIHFLTESSMLWFFVLGVLDWNTLFIKHWLRFVFAPILVISGSIILVWGMRTLTLRMSLGSKDKLVKKGPYRYSRNPQYVGTILLLSGSALLFNSLYQSIAGIIGILVFVLAAFVEEPWLENQYKEEYANYNREVPRFMFKPAKVGATILVPLIGFAFFHLSQRFNPQTQTNSYPLPLLLLILLSYSLTNSLSTKKHTQTKTHPKSPLTKARIPVLALSRQSKNL